MIDTLAKTDRKLGISGKFLQTIFAMAQVTENLKLNLIFYDRELNLTSQFLLK